MKNSSQTRMPVLFVGHGNPMNALGGNEYARGWRSLVQDLSRPKAILCISAHWETRGTYVNATTRPETIHDFYGFPEDLYRISYPCPGSPETASRVREMITLGEVETDQDRGLDHGTWAVLCHMFPDADVPVFQLSLDATRPARYHYEMGRELRPLKNEGVLIIGSGNLVHNLSLADMSGDGHPHEWAVNFDHKLAKFILAGEIDHLIDYDTFEQGARLSIPTEEHYLPFLYTLALRDKGDDVTFVNEKIAHRSVGMRSVRFG
jgi:4,5-DOPA dioxygenase extradiol